ncbi:MAG: phosphoribosylglycinamide formyltransferase [Eubacterium sp.]|nr:phosphoribosylglycinamide formyltransferase [Eubacterium sp.]
MPVERKARVAVLVSGGGTNLQAILDAQDSGIIHSGEVVLVATSNPNAYAITRAQNHGVPTYIFKGEDDLADKLRAEDIDLIVLAGFLKILSRDFVTQFPDRIINVHPALIPSFCGKGCYGLHVHEKALAYGVKVTGATVHFVNEIPDGGRIIAQKAVDIEEGDTPEVLQRRVMEQAEWIILPAAVEKVSAEIVKGEES